MKKEYRYDLEIFKDNILINTETYSGGVFSLPYHQDLIWDAKENKILPISEYVRKKKVADRKKKIESIKNKI